MPVIDITESRTLFNYCSLESYTEEGVKPLLEWNSVHNETLFAIYWDDRRFNGCDEFQIEFRYVQYPTLLAQRLGKRSQSAN